MENLEFVFPEIFVSLSIMFLLILGVFKKRFKTNSKFIFDNFTYNCCTNI